MCSTDTPLPKVQSELCRVNDIKVGNKMSENRRRREDPTEIVAQSTVLGIIGAQNRDSETVENHTRQIESLKKEIEEKDNTLSRLNKELKDLQAQNDDLQITLESRNQEIEALKDKVDKLETERKILEKKLQYVELEFKDLKIQNDEKNKEIRDLKISLESKDNEITAMKRELKDLKDQNDERAKEIKVLTISLESKDKEIIALKDKIRGLENALKSLELCTEALEKEWEDAREASRKSEKDREEMKLTIEKLSKNIQRMTKERDQKEQDDLKWKKEFQESMQRAQSYGRGSQSLPDPAENAFILLGQMCSQVQAMMYKIVLPDRYNEEYLYKLKFIEEDIAREKEDLKHKATERWDELKRKLSWDDMDHPRTLKEIQRKRNEVAHPNLLTKELLYNSAEMMQEAGKLSGRMTLTRVRQIIKIWDLLNQME